MRAAFLSLSLALLTRADDVIDAKKVPAACQSVCAPPQQLARLCDVRGDNISDKAKEQQELQCICRNESFDVARFYGLCASCLEQNVDQIVTGDEVLRAKDLDDINRHMKGCGFPAGSFTQADANAGDGVQVALNGNSATAGSSSQAPQPSRTGAVAGTGTSTSTARPSTNPGTSVTAVGASGIQVSMGLLVAAVAAAAGLA